jgi:hypothetical protein
MTFVSIYEDEVNALKPDQRNKVLFYFYYFAVGINHWYTMAEAQKSRISMDSEISVGAPIVKEKVDR